MTTFDHVVVVRSDIDSRDEPSTTRAHHGPVGPPRGRRGREQTVTMQRDGDSAAMRAVVSRSIGAVSMTRALLIVAVVLALTILAVPAVAHGSDYDSDGLPDDEEVEYGTGIDDRDTDGDDLIDGVEVYETGTDPTNPDTDGDGVTDGEEHAAGSDPTDPEDTPDVWDRLASGAAVPYILGGIVATAGLAVLAVSLRRRSAGATDGD